jgi:hypothetical protein
MLEPTGWASARPPCARKDKITAPLCGTAQGRLSISLFTPHVWFGRLLSFAITLVNQLTCSSSTIVQVASPHATHV